MRRFNVHGIPTLLTAELAGADPQMIITLTAATDNDAQRLAQLLCGMDVQEIECAECSMALEDCWCEA